MFPFALHSINIHTNWLRPPSCRLCRTIRLDRHARYLLPLPSDGRDPIFNKSRIHLGFVLLSINLVRNSLPTCNVFPWSDGFGLHGGVHRDKSNVHIKILDSSSANRKIKSLTEKHIQCSAFLQRIDGKTQALVITRDKWTFYGYLGLVGLRYFYTYCQLSFYRYRIRLNYYAKSGTAHFYDSCWIQCRMRNSSRKKYWVRLRSECKALLWVVYDTFIRCSAIPKYTSPLAWRLYNSCFH